jgi:hypothetical protein
MNSSYDSAKFNWLKLNVHQLLSRIPDEVLSLRLVLSSLHSVSDPKSKTNTQAMFDQALYR